MTLNYNTAVDKKSIKKRLPLQSVGLKNLVNPEHTSEIANTFNISSTIFLNSTAYFGRGNRSIEIPHTWQLGQLKEQAGFLVSRILTLLSTPT